MIDNAKKFLGWIVLPATILLAVIWRIATSLSSARSELARNKAEAQLGDTLGKLAVAEKDTKNAEGTYADALAAYHKARDGDV